MRKGLILAVAMIIAYSSAAAPSAEAARRGGLFAGNRSNGGFFSNLMELERRKNAWLRATFLGR
ncbi:MAG: hypothetical protein R3C49_19265 [Planctomycetaceae bacterium]